MENDYALLEQFSHSCALFSSVQGGFFFKEKATYHRAFGAQQLENSDSHQPQGL
jgi:hypothetical protein